MAEAPSSWRWARVHGLRLSAAGEALCQVRRGRVDIHRDQGIVERFNRTLAERLFGHQYAQEMRLPSGERSTEWVKRLPSEKWPGQLAKSPLMPSRPRCWHIALLCSPWAPSWTQRSKCPLGSRRSLSLPARWTRGWSPAGHWPDVVSWSVPAGTLGDQARRARVVLPAGWRCPTAHTATTGWGPQALNNSSIHPATSRDDRIPVSICQRVHPIFFRSSAWNQRVRETLCSDVARRCDGALTARHPCHGGMFAFRRGPLCTARAWCASSRHSFLHPSPSWCFIFGRRPTYSAIARRRTRLLTFQEPSCWPNCTEGGPGGSRMCHRGFGSGPCPCTRPRSRSQGEGCQCSCRGAGSSPYCVLSCYNRSRTSGAWRDSECSCPHTPGDWVPGCSCGPG